MTEKEAKAIYDNEGNLVRIEGEGEGIQDPQNANLYEPPEKYKVKEKVPFTKCVIHESKLAYKWYVWFIVVSIGALAICWILSEIWSRFGSGIITGLSFVMDIFIWVFTLIFATISAIPWWIEVVAILLLLPVAYAVIVCWIRRSKISLVGCFLTTLFTFFFGVLIIIPIGIKYNVGFWIIPILGGLWLFIYLSFVNGQSGEGI